MSAKKFYDPTEDELVIIRKHYDSTAEGTSKIMTLLGNRYPRWFIQRTACKLKLTRRGTAERWTPVEEAILEKNLTRRNKAYLERTLGRSWVSIKKKMYKMRLKKHEIGLTKQQALDILGHKHRYLMDKWISSGKLHTMTKHTERTEAQGGDMYHVEPKYLRQFIIEHYNEIDFGAVDRFLFVQCLIGEL